MDEASAASTSINLLSLGPKTSVGCGLTRQFSTGPGKNPGFIRGPFLASNGLLPDIYREGCRTQTCRSCTLWSRSACRTRRGNGSMSASPSRGALQSRADHHRCRSPCTASRSSSRFLVRWQILQCVASIGLLEQRCCLCPVLQGGEDNRTVVSLALALQMLKKGNEDLLQIFMSGAPEPGSVQQVASYLGQSEGNGASSKLRGAATTSAGALAC